MRTTSCPHVDSAAAAKRMVFADADQPPPAGTDLPLGEPVARRGCSLLPATARVR
jgi:hypothetical protein